MGPPKNPPLQAVTKLPVPTLFTSCAHLLATSAALLNSLRL